MKYIEYEFELEEFLEQYFATVWIKVECMPGEEDVFNLPNGDPGYPGSPATFCVVEAHVTSIEGDISSLNYEELKQHKQWHRFINREVLEAAQKLIDNQAWLYDAILDILSTRQ